MSDKVELLEGQVSRTRIVASWAFSIALIAFAWIVMAFIVNHDQTDSIRDLQRRVAELEQRR